ncbi:hypothetical protein CKN73_09030 [Carnobacterium divergens]|nr:hypothetical protein CKN77_09130 [Carnobacterium divergens]TFJ49104.1 hypothetical protein CKN73_09030 [Carnobacterium divergens]TFJ54368.1 hypothetical protein CKN83_08935 [Carnobacterium divergens]TFJ59894.1 hypothetical protein CKN89_09375 [Carnobacterium divergens]TFJ70538.1 hypothetical protein CKN91_08990 [Carnobacterium divergens]
MKSIDKRNSFKETPFDYSVIKDNKMMIYWHRKHIKIITGKEFVKVKSKIELAVNQDEIQLILAKFTRNFKRGNEK